MLENQKLLADSLWALYEHSAMKFLAREFFEALTEDIKRLKERINSQ
jgi:hypothetical protein